MYNYALVNHIYIQYTKGSDKKNDCKIVNIFLTTGLNICFGCSKDAFECHQVFFLMDEILHIIFNFDISINSTVRA